MSKEVEKQFIEAFELQPLFLICKVEQATGCSGCLVLGSCTLDTCPNWVYKDITCNMIGDIFRTFINFKQTITVSTVSGAWDIEDLQSTSFNDIVMLIAIKYKDEGLLAPIKTMFALNYTT